MSGYPAPGTAYRWNDETPDVEAASVGLPAKAARLLRIAVEHGYRWAVIWDEDTASNRYVIIMFSSEQESDGWTQVRITLTWHTRPTGGKTLRLFSNAGRAPGRPYAALRSLAATQNLLEDHAS